MSAMDNDLDDSQRIDKCARLYYSTLDNFRHLIGRWYLDTASFSWNGIAQQGRENIEMHLLKLPGSQHKLETVQAQPILDTKMNPNATHIVMTSGWVNYNYQPLRGFEQTFCVTMEDDKWKIASDSYRLTEKTC